MSEVADKPCTWDDLQPGVRVRCIYQDPRVPRYGLIATIVLADRVGQIIDVMWDDGDLAYPRWGQASSFALLDTSSVVPTPIPVRAMVEPPSPEGGEQSEPFDFDTYNGFKPKVR